MEGADMSNKEIQQVLSPAVYVKLSKNFKIESCN